VISRCSKQAVEAGVTKFIYVAFVKTPDFEHLEITRIKERWVLLRPVSAVPDARVKQGGKKKAVLITTGDAADEYAPIAEPCFEVMSGHFMVEEIDVVEQLYVGMIHGFDEQRYKDKMAQTFAMGVRLVEEIEKSRKEG